MAQQTLSGVEAQAPRNITLGPRGAPLIGVLPQFRKAPHRLCVDVMLEYGDFARLNIGPVTFYLLSHPDAISHILQDNYRNYNKGYKAVRELLGDGLLMSEGSYWLRQRRLMQPAFHQRRLEGLALTITDLTTAMLDRWDDSARRGQSIDLLSEMVGLAREAVLGAMFSATSDRDAQSMGDELDIVMTALFNRLFSLVQLPLSWPLPEHIRFRQSIERLNEVISGIIEERRNNEEDQGDLFSMLLSARDEETGEGMNDQQLRDEVITMYLAGHETTAVTLTWAWSELARHPQVVDKLRAEHDAVLGGRVPTFADLPNLVYTRMVFDETLRLYPPAWQVTRQAIAEDNVLGYRVPAGGTVMISPYALHRHPSYWEDPERFDPERFTPERCAARPRFAYIPFGGGPRKCIGDQFALMEARLVLPLIMQRFDLQLLPGQTIAPVPRATLRPPRYGIQMALHAREAMPA